MSEKTFLVKMDDIEFCSNCLTFTHRTYCILNNKNCGGNLNNRPEWCPLVELEKRCFDDQILYAEVEV